MTANIVPVCNITRSNVIDGADGSRPISFSATMTCAELETGNSSAKPCTIARTITFKSGMPLILGVLTAAGSRLVEHPPRGAAAGKSWGCAGRALKVLWRAQGAALAVPAQKRARRSHVRLYGPRPCAGCMTHPMVRPGDEAGAA